MPGPAVVTGVPGVGASRICEGARRDLGDAFTLVNFGDVMLEEALERGLTDSRDGLGELSIRDLRILQRRAGEYVARKRSEGPLLVNTHLVVNTVHGFLPGLPPAVLSDVDPAALVVVDASPETIQRRRETSSRSYPDEPRSVVAFQRQLQNAAAVSAAGAAGAPIRHVSNEGGIDTAAENLARVADTVATRGGSDGD